MDTITIFDSTKDLCEKLTDMLRDLLKDKKILNLNLSGGSTPKALFQYWSKQNLPWEKIHFYWGDERCVAPSDDMSNYGMTKKYLLDNINIPNENIFRIKGEAEPEAEAERYSELIPDKFDLILLGMGEDGHTASIFPYNIQLWNSPKNCVVAAHPDTGMLRISITGRVINKAEQVIFLITGNSKAQRLKEIFANSKQAYDKFPAAKVNPTSGKLYFFLDKESASELRSLK